MKAQVIPFVETDMEKQEITMRYRAASISLSEEQAMALGITLIHSSCELRDFRNPAIELTDADLATLNQPRQQ